MGFITPPGTITAAAGGIPELKPLGQQTPRDIVAYVKSKLYYTSPLRRYSALMWRKAELYDSHTQAIKLAYASSDATSATNWVRDVYEPNDPNSLPKPVLNKGLSPRQNESARLGRPEYKPKVRPEGENPDIKAKLGAKKGQQILNDRLRRMMWDKEEDLLTYHMPLYGGCWLRGEYDLSWLDTECYPVLTAKACPRKKGADVLPEASPSILPGAEGAAAPPEGAEPIPPTEECDFVLSSPKVGKEHFGQLGILPADDEAEEAELDSCPQCEDHPPLVPFKPTLEEAREAKDTLGRPLGQDLPKGELKFSVRSPYDVFARNGGIDVDPGDVMDELTEASVETLDWLAARFPDKIRDKDGNLLVKPENQAKLMEFHPIAGAPDVYGSGRNADLFRNSVRVIRHYKKPWNEWNPKTKKYEKNQGRAILTAGDQVLFDGTFMVQSKTNPKKYVPRVHYEYVIQELRNGGRVLDGVGMWEGMFDAQDGFNQRAAQCWAVNQRGALPFYLEDADANLSTAEADSTIPFRRIQATVNPEGKFQPLTLLNNEVINAGVYTEMQIYDAFLRALETEVESGSVPPGVSAATAIAYLKNESAEKRRPRIKRIRLALERLWQWGLNTIQANYIEERPYSYEDEDGNEKDSYFKGLDLNCEPKVTIEASPDFDTEDLRREELRDLVTLGVLKPDANPQMPRKLQKIIAPMIEVFLDDDLQEEQAQREYSDFIDNGRLPVVDPSLDDHVAHYQEHGRACFSEQFRDLEDRANWDGALELLSASWDADIQSVAVQAPQLLPPGVPQPPPGIPPEVIQQAVEQGRAAGTIPPAPPQLSLQTRIKEMWEDKLLKSKFQSPDPKAMYAVLCWRAHNESHKLSGENKIGQAETGAPQLAAPGAEATAAGTEPTPSQPPPVAPQEMAAMAGGPPQ